MKLKDKVAFVTGASSGIGRACARHFKDEGALVFGVARRAARLREELDHWRMVDVTSNHDVAAAVEQCSRELGGIDVLVNAAGIFLPGGLLDGDDEVYERTFRVNVDALRRVTRACAPYLIERRGAIVNISSVCSLRPYAAIAAYCMSKAAVDMFTQCIALELAPRGVRVHAVNPGVVVTELHTAGNAVPDYEAFLERAKETHPLGRPGQPEEIAALCAFLASEEAGWMTGGIHSVDGGRALTSLR